MRRAGAALALLAAVAGRPAAPQPAVAGTAHARQTIPPPVARGQAADRAAPARRAAPSHARGLRWRAGPLPAGDRLLSFEVALRLAACTARPARPLRARPADATATPFAARRYVAGHADTGPLLRADRDRDRGGRDRPGHVHVPGRARVAQRAPRRTGARGYPGRAGADRAAFMNGTARAAHRLQPGILPGLPAALQRGRRRAHRQLPGRRRAVEAAAAPARLLRPARSPLGSHRVRGPHRERAPGTTTAVVPLAGRAAARRRRRAPGTRRAAGIRRTSTAPATRCAGTGRSAG